MGGQRRGRVLCPGYGHRNTSRIDSVLCESEHHITAMREQTGSTVANAIHCSEDRGQGKCGEIVWIDVPVHQIA